MRWSGTERTTRKLTAAISIWPWLASKNRNLMISACLMMTVGSTPEKRSSPTTDSTTQPGRKIILDLCPIPRRRCMKLSLKVGMCSLLRRNRARKTSQVSNLQRQRPPKSKSKSISRIIDYRFLHRISILTNFCNHAWLNRPISNLYSLPT